MEETASFEDSRRLTGPNLFFARPGAVLEALGVDAVPKDVIEQWRINVRAMSAELGGRMSSCTCVRMPAAIHWR